MDEIPSLLMLCWNRREYFERTIANLLSDPSDFRLHIWDNGSTDGVADIVRDLDDPRIVDRFHSRENIGQAQPWHWFLDRCAGDIVGKIDDDIIGETGWMKRFAAMIAAEPLFGTLGAWVYQPEEWDADRAEHKMRAIGPYRIFENPWVPGGIFVGRKAALVRFSSRDPGLWGVPLDQSAMVRAGFVNGYPLPISFAHHLDDPRSPHCRMNQPGKWDQFAAYSARMRNFSGPEEYGRWIAADARLTLETPVADQLRRHRPGPRQRMRAIAGNLLAPARRWLRGP